MSSTFFEIDQAIYIISLDIKQYMFDKLFANKSKRTNTNDGIIYTLKLFFPPSL